MSYKAVKSDSKYIVTFEDNEKTAYTLSKSAFDLAKLAIAGGGSPEEVFASLASVTAKSARSFDPERAAKEAAKAAKLKALEAFNSTIASHVWSDKVQDLANNVVTLRNQVANSHFNFAVRDSEYERISPSKACGKGQYRFTFYKGIPTLVVGLRDPLPAEMTAEGELRVAEHEFRMVAASEVKVPDVLVSENAEKHFDIDENGNIVFSVNITVRGGNSGGGRRRKVMYQGTVYDSKTELGKAVNGEVKYPHKVAESLIQQGKAEYVD